MTEIILVRHGETEWNVKERFRGRIDLDLNETGMKQAELLAKYLSWRKIEAIYSSPLQRALKTAKIMAKSHKIEVSIAPGLIDFNFGEWEGLTPEEVKAKFPELFRVWVSHPERVKIPSGESLEEVSQRSTAVVAEIVKRYSGAAVLVSHRVVNKVIICGLLGLDNSHFWNIKQDHCGITIFIYENGRFVLTKHNDTSFLEPLNRVPRKDF